MLRCSVKMGSFCFLLIGGCVSSNTITQEEARLCNAFYMLAQNVEDTGQAQSVTVFKERPMEVACSREENDAAQSSYCAAVLQSVSMEFTHGYPWKLKRCLLSKGVTPRVETADEYTGLVDRDKIVRLEATVFGEVDARLSWVPSAEHPNTNKIDQYWGRYELILSKR